MRKKIIKKITLYLLFLVPYTLGTCMKENSTCLHNSYGHLEDLQLPHGNGESISQFVIYRCMKSETPKPFQNVGLPAARLTKARRTRLRLSLNPARFLSIVHKATNAKESLI